MTLDDHATDGGAFKFLLQVFANADIFSQHAAEVLVVGVPARSPVAVNREAEPNRVYFLSHCDSLSSDFDHNVASLLLDTVTATFCTRGETLHRLALVNINSGDFEFIDIGAVFVLGVGDRGLKSFLDDARVFLLCASQAISGLGKRHATEQGHNYN